MNPRVLSHVHGIGRISRCSHCPDLHIGIGPVDIRVPEEALAGLVTMFSQALGEVRLEQASPIQTGIETISIPLSLC